MFGSERAASFGQAAGVYERGRPEYPPAAIDWLLPQGARRVADVGAGTGKLTRQLVARGLEVVAVEPSDGMREQLQAKVPGAEARAGTAEKLPLEDGSVDAVLFAQAWHWVDVDRASAEAARVLAPGGTLGVLWNVRDERVDWVAELGRIIHDETDERSSVSTKPRVGPPFGEVERFDTRWTWRIAPETLRDLVRSRSHFITRPTAERDRILASVQDLIENHAALKGRGIVDLPLVTRCGRCRVSP